MKALQKKIRQIQRTLLDGVVRRTAVSDLEERSEFFATLFDKYFASHSKIIDIGGGWGFYAKPLKDRGHHLTVVDVVKPGFQKSPVVIYPGDRLPFADKSFDASILVTMLHHTPDPKAILKEAMRVTKTRMIVVEDLYHHALGRWWTIFRDQLYNFEFFGHPRSFKTKDQWLEVFRGLGLKVIDQQNVYTRLAGMRILNGIFVLETL